MPSGGTPASHRLARLKSEAELNTARELGQAGATWVLSCRATREFSSERNTRISAWR